MKNSIHLMELILMILYIPMYFWIYYKVILRVEYFPDAIDLLVILPLMLVNFCYFLFVLCMRKDSIIKYLIYIVLFLLLYAIIYIIIPLYAHYLPDPHLYNPHLILFCISLGIAFFYYRGKKKLVKAINSKL